MPRPLAVIVLAAGLGKRTKVSLPKVLLPLCGRTVLGTVLDVVAGLQPKRTLVVVHHGKPLIEKALAGRDVQAVDQGSPRGTGHAAQVALGAIADFRGDAMIVNGDCPLVTEASLRELKESRRDAAAALLTAVADDPTGLGRVQRDAKGDVFGIVEEKDCTDEQKGIDEINAGFYCFDGEELRGVIGRLSDQNAQRELYLTDAVRHLAAAGKRIVGVPLADADEAQGINTLAELALAREVMQHRILLRHLENGVVIEDPSTVWIDHDVEIGADTRILPCSVIRSGCKVGKGCEVGPFAHLRAGTVLEDGAEIGNFVEVKNSKVGSGTKAKHLTYLGDATIGRNANIGAGTITANYDGKHKHKTWIDDEAFIGSGTVLVAPSKIGKGAKTGAGAIVTRNQEIEPGDVWVGVPARSMKTRKGGGER
jgi:bifunctional UDP-N-acetylglucosamine pyrophosphorylase/glucosamine-1-phosphate N-acetyltransferase